jgi:hypothetical protein
MLEQKGGVMTTVMTHEPSTGKTGIAERLLVPGFWGAVSIVAMWLAVLFDGIFGADMTFANATNGPDGHPVSGAPGAVRCHRHRVHRQARLRPPGRRLNGPGTAARSGR